MLVVPGLSSDSFGLQSPGLLQAIAAGSRQRLPKAIAEIAEKGPQDVQARLQNIFVYTVTNNNNELILLSGEVQHIFHGKELSAAEQEGILPVV